MQLTMARDNLRTNEFLGLGLNDLHPSLASHNMVLPYHKDHQKMISIAQDLIEIVEMGPVFEKAANFASQHSL